jgi:putative transposase
MTGICDAPAAFMTSLQNPIRLYGSKISYYTGKMEGYLRFKEIPYDFVVLGRENMSEVRRASRYRISPIDTDAYLLKCCRYVELNPVKARICMQAEQYHWSSYQARLGLKEAHWLDEDSCFEALGANLRQRRLNYKVYVEDWVDARSSQQFIRTALDRNQLTGRTVFTDQIERKTGIRIEYRGRGRPAKKHEEIEGDQEVAGK